MTAAADLRKRLMQQDNAFYQKHFHHILIFLMLLTFAMICITGFILYQIFHRPLPLFSAVQENGQSRNLLAYREPNLLPDTLLRWASKAATLAYTFDFVNYDQEIESVRPYFTASGWRDYLQSVTPLISTIVKNQLFINGVVSGPPVISNQGALPEIGYSWRIQIPFLVTYQSANTTSKRNYYVMLTIVRVPTALNPQGIGIDQFVMA